MRDINTPQLPKTTGGYGVPCSSKMLQEMNEYVDLETEGWCVIILFVGMQAYITSSR